MNKRSIAVILMTTLILAGCAKDTYSNAADTESSVASVETTASTSGVSEMSTSSEHSDVPALPEANALYEKGTKMLKEQRKDVYNCDDEIIIEALGYLSEALRLYDENLNPESASEVLEAANYIAKLTFDYDKGGTIWSKETMGLASTVNGNAVHLLNKVEYLLENAEEDNTTTEIVSPEIDTEDDETEADVDDGNIAADVNEGVSNAYGMIGNYTNTEYNDEWGLLGAADPINRRTYFSGDQFEDLMKFVKSGYIGADKDGRMVKDPRIVSRAGGIDNPRMPWWSNYKYFDYWDPHTESEACWLVVNKDALITRDIAEIIEDPESTDGMYEVAQEAVYGPDMCPSMEVSYSARNYCGDAINIIVRGDEVDCSGSLWMGERLGENPAAVAGIDYIVECKEDPDAIRLLTTEETKNYILSTGNGGGLCYHRLDTLLFSGVDRTLDTAEYAMYSAYSKSGLKEIPIKDYGYVNYKKLMGGHYIATKPGIFTLTVTSTKTGDSMDIVIENLPVHYERLLWGCATQREMDLVVGYHLNSPRGISTESNAVERWNEKGGWPDINDERFRLKDTAEAEEYARYLPILGYTYVIAEPPIAYNGYSAYGFLVYGQGDCEATSAVAQSALCLSGITTRFVGTDVHGWIEFLVPASITEDGQDHWVRVNGGNYFGVEDPYWRGSPLEGWDYWK